MAKAYPVAYRREAREAGFHRPQAPVGIQIPRPANDNQRVSKPANDNIPSRRGPSPKQMAKAMLRTGLLRLVRPFPTPFDMALELALGYSNQGQVLDPYFNLHGYTLISGPCPRTPEFTEFVTNTSSLGCLGGQSRTETLPDWNVGMYPPVQVGSLQRGIIVWQFTNCVGNPGLDWESCMAVDPSAPRYAIHTQYVRPAGLQDNISPRWYPAPYYVPAYNPLLDPNYLPIGLPVPVPRPLPYRALSYASKQREKVAREQSPTRTEPYAIPVQLPLSPGFAPLTSPVGLTTQIWPVVGGMAPIPALHQHRYEPPPPGTKERKLILAAGGALAAAANILTESADFVEALYFAIPGYLRPYKGRTTVQERVDAIYRHFKDIDIAQAVENLLVNEAGDRIGGSKGRLSREAKRRFYNRTGVNLLPSF